MENQQLDPTIVALTKAIGHQESGGDYNKTGDNGHSRGAYQWNNPTPLATGQVPKNFASYASEVGADANDFSPENQDRVAYETVKKWGSQGLSPAQIASKWNSGSPDSYKTAKAGYNAEQGVSYDVKSYVDNVAKYYDEFNQSSQTSEKPQGLTPPTPVVYNPQTENAQPEPQKNVSNGSILSDTFQGVGSSLGKELVNRGSDIANAAKDTISGKINPLSGVLQGVGGVAGGLGDIVNKGLEIIPGVKQATGLLGKGIGKLADTKLGQSVTEGANKFSNKHPELSKDIGAVFNIVTAIPILKGIGTAGKIAKEGISLATKGAAEKAFISGAPELLGNTQKAAKLVNKNPNVFKEMVDRRLVGDIEKGVYTTGKDVERSWNTIKQSNAEIDSILKKQYKDKITIGTEDTDIILKDAINEFPQSNFTPDDLFKNAERMTQENGKLWDKFRAGNASFEDINKLRSDLDRATKSVYSSISEPPIKKAQAKAVADAMRKFIKDQATETVPHFNEMSTQFDIQSALNLMNGKAVAPGSTAKFIGHATGVGVGSSVGGAIGGVPGAIGGGMIGEGLAKTISNKIAGRNITQGILKRTGVNASRTPVKKAAIDIGGLVAGSTAQRINR